MIYRPRNDWVLVRIHRHDFVKGIRMPQVAIEGKQFVIEAVGPQVEGLQPGDTVLMVGSKAGAEFYPLPNSVDLLVIREEFVALVMEEET